ncbi:MAG TPA: hypothetical protein PKC28_09855 [Bdellovibrionales bacterium]|nr:hypothetical protein [Bdellovibrionales bacterium]
MKIITHLLCLAIGLTLGIWLAKPPAPEVLSVEAPVAEAPVEPAEPAAVESPPAANMATAQPSAPATRPSSAQDLASIKRDFDAQVGSGDLAGAAASLKKMEAFRESQEYAESSPHLLMAQRNYPAARPLLQECVRRFPDSQSCMTDLTMAELETGEREDQERVVRDCLNRRPDDDNCRNADAIVKMNYGNYEEAVRVYEDILKNNGRSGGTRIKENVLN